MKNLSPDAFQGAVTATGAPINATDIIKNGILKSYRDGQYLVQLGNNSAAGSTSKPYVMAANGQLFILDLTQRAQHMRSVEGSTPPSIIQTATNANAGAGFAAGMMP